MGKIDVYVGGYLVIDEVSKTQSELLASNACLIGMPVVLTYQPQTDEGPEQFAVTLPSGQVIGVAHPKNRLAIREAVEQGWTRRACLSLVYYDATDKLFKGEIAYQLFNILPDLTQEQANTEAFCDHTAERIAAGQRPSLTLSGNAWEQVKTTGDWSDGNTVPLPIDTSRTSGTVVFKRRRSLSDKLAAAALNGNPGCRVAVTVTLILIAALVLFLVVRCTSGR